MKARVKELIELSDRQFSKRSSLLTLWQTTAEQFYPERADFTSSRQIGEEFASHLMTGRPLMARRDLANTFSAMLRPRSKPWFHARTNDEAINKDAASRAWLDDKSDVMRRAMYDKNSGFVRATKEGDNDFSAFGQTVIEVTPNRYLDGMLYRCWHLRDVAWCENAELQIDTAFRRWKLEARTLVETFPKTAAQQVRKLLAKEPYKEINCRHIVMPADAYDLSEKKSGRKLPFVSIYVDVDNETILEEVPRRTLGYVIPRWQTVSGSQYAHSPATVIALPDARLLQQITLTLLEAGQKAVDPPLVAVSEAISGAINTYAGGVTYVDAEYDERLGEALRPISQEKNGLSWGDKREEMVHQLINEAFFLNQIQVPMMEGDMTATEYRGRVEEYIRRALPLFEPMEVEYNGGICDETFDVLLHNGAFGSLEDMPQQLRGQSIRFQFESPLQAANERAKTQAFMEASQLLAQAVQLDPTTKHDLDVNKAFREALVGVAPADWVVPEEEAQKAKQAEREMMMREQMALTAAKTAALVQQGGDAAQSAGAGAQALQDAGMV
jgi:hypothetical protein